MKRLFTTLLAVVVTGSFSASALADGLNDLRQELVTCSQAAGASATPDTRVTGAAVFANLENYSQIIWELMDENVSSVTVEGVDLLVEFLWTNSEGQDQNQRVLVANGGLTVTQDSDDNWASQFNKTAGATDISLAFTLGLNEEAFPGTLTVVVDADTPTESTDVYALDCAVVE